MSYITRSASLILRPSCFPYVCARRDKAMVAVSEFAGGMVFTGHGFMAAGEFTGGIVVMGASGPD